jgi:hypothetical protein
VKPDSSTSLIGPAPLPISADAVMVRGMKVDISLNGSYWFTWKGDAKNLDECDRCAAEISAGMAQELGRPFSANDLAIMAIMLGEKEPNLNSVGLIINALARVDHPDHPGGLHGCMDDPSVNSVTYDLALGKAGLAVTMRPIYCVLR